MYSKYFVYCDDGDHVGKFAVAAVSKENAAAHCASFGDVVAVKEVTEEYNIDILEVESALTEHGFGHYEIDFI